MTISSKENFKQIGRSKLSDWELLKLDSADGLKGIYASFFDELYKFGMSIHPNRDFIKDCIHDVFVDLWKYRKTLGNTNNVKFYLLKCLTHKIYNQVEKEKRSPFDYNEDVYKTSLTENPYEKDLIAEQTQEKLKDKLRAALAALPIRQKQVIQLLFFENCSYEDASKIMGIGIKSTYNMAWKAISLLKKSMLYVILIFI